MARKGHVISEMVQKGHVISERVAPQPQAAGNTGSAWQRGRALTSSTKQMLGTVSLIRVFLILSDSGISETL